MERVGPRNVRPIKTLCPSILILSYLPVNVCICILLRTLFAQTGYAISTLTYAVQTEREWQTNIPIFLPGIVKLLLTVLLSFTPIKFYTWCHLTPESDNQPVRRELRAWTVPIDMLPTQCSLLPTPWAGKIRWSLIHFGIFTHGFALRSVFTHRRNLLEKCDIIYFCK